jgi:2',3'-cyclic-nucleotide 2'-phosphodiesterase (5'-nucleotidase family)
VQAGAHGSDVGRLDLTFADGRIASHQRTLITLDHATVPADPPTAELIASLEKPFRSQLDEIIGEALSSIPRAQTLAGQEPRKRDQPSPADTLFAEILRETTGSEIALLPGVGYGVALQPGPVTAEALRDLVPHESKVVTLTLTGAQIREILATSSREHFQRRSEDESRRDDPGERPHLSLRSASASG